MAKPLFKVTYKGEDGNRHTVATVWPSDYGPTLTPVRSDKVQEKFRERALSDAVEEWERTGRGFFDLFDARDRPKNESEDDDL